MHESHVPLLLAAPVCYHRPSRLDFCEGENEAFMQFTTSTQQLTTCPQCDNVVRIDAEFCNICGKRLRPAANGVRNDRTPVTTPSYLSRAQQAEDDDEYEDDHEYSDEDEDD